MDFPVDFWRAAREIQLWTVTALQQYDSGRFVAALQVVVEQNVLETEKWQIYYDRSGLSMRYISTIVVDVTNTVGYQWLTTNKGYWNETTIKIVSWNISNLDHVCSVTVLDHKSYITPSSV